MGNPIAMRAPEGSMQLSQFTDYSLRVLMYLGFRGDEQVTIAEISRAYGVSRNYLMKVVSHLAAKGYVHTIRGKGGGLRLARHPTLINLGEVIRECEPDFNVVDCLGPVQSSCPLMPECVLRTLLREAVRGFLGTLERYSLQDLVANRHVGTALLRNARFLQSG
jgi:Rrf2 family transcriptional regulator, nitric oxide-sensitive transcriptional repressor